MANDSGKWAVAIDFGGTKTMVGLVGRTGAIAASRTFPTDLSVSPAGHFAKCMAAAEAIFLTTGIRKSEVAGIGVTLPGMADPARGVLLHAPFSGWRDVPVRELLNAYKTGMPVSVANDVNACALAESMFGSARGLAHYLWVTVSTGVGGGLVLDGRMYEGESHIAGELGHVIVEWEASKARRCPCGHDGCLEAHASGTAIAGAARSFLEANGWNNGLGMFMAASEDGSGGQRSGDPGAVTAQRVAAAAREGIPEAAAIMTEAGDYLGRAISYAANLLNPGAVFIGGGVALSFDLLEPGLRSAYGRGVIGSSNKSMRIVRTGLGYEAGLLGAAALVFQNDPGASF